MSKRTNFTAAQKVAIVREHLIEKVPVSTLCDKHKISPVNFYNWQRLLFENAEGCFDRKKNSANAKRQDEAAARKIEQWVPHEIRDQVVDYVERWTAKTEVTQSQLLSWAGLWSSTFCKWKRYYARPLNTTLGFPAIIGLRTGRSRPSFSFTSIIHSMAIVD